MEKIPDDVMTDVILFYLDGEDVVQWMHCVRKVYNNRYRIYLHHKYWKMLCTKKIICQKTSNQSQQEIEKLKCRFEPMYGTFLHSLYENDDSIVSNELQKTFVDWKQMYARIWNAQRNRCSLCFKTYKPFVFYFPQVIRICFGCLEAKFITASEVQKRYGNVALSSKKRKRMEEDEKEDDDKMILAIKRYGSRVTYLDEDVQRYSILTRQRENNEENYEIYHNPIHYMNPSSVGFQKWIQEAKIIFKYSKKRKDIEWEETVSLNNIK